MVFGLYLQGISSYVQIAVTPLVKEEVTLVTDYRSTHFNLVSSYYHSLFKSVLLK